MPHRKLAPPGWLSQSHDALALSQAEKLGRTGNKTGMGPRRARSGQMGGQTAGLRPAVHPSLLPPSQRGRHKMRGSEQRKEQPSMRQKHLKETPQENIVRPQSWGQKIQRTECMYALLPIHLPTAPYTYTSTSKWPLRAGPEKRSPNRRALPSPGGAGARPGVSPPPRSPPPPSGGATCSSPHVW